jgi:hypothetical protein
MDLMTNGLRVGDHQTAFYAMEAQTSPSAEDELIAIETLLEISMTTKSSFEDLDTNLDDEALMANALREAKEQKKKDAKAKREETKTDDSELECDPIVLNGPCIDMTFKDTMLCLNEYMVLSIIQGVYEKVQFMKITSEDLVERIREQARNPKRILTESRGDYIEDIDYELPGLTPDQAFLMEDKIDQIDLCETIMSSCRVWWKANDTGITKQVLQKRSDNTIRDQLTRGKEKKSEQEREKLARIREHNRAKRHAA